MEKFSLTFWKHPLKGHTRISTSNMLVKGREELNRIVAIFTANPDVKRLAVYEHRTEEYVTLFENRDIRTK